MLQQTYIINSDLKMGKGKIGAQTAHGAVFYMENALSYPMCCTEDWAAPTHDKYIEWIKDGLMKKIVLKATEEELNQLSTSLNDNNIWNHKVIDFGLTQVAPNSFTCLVVEPLSEEFHKRLFGELKLL